MNPKLAWSAILTELSALALLLMGSSSLAVMFAYLSLHGAGSALLALALSQIVPARYRSPRGWLLVYLFCFNLFMPFAGLLCAVVALLFGTWLPRLQDGSGFGTTAPPRFTTHRNHEGTGFRGGQVRAQLGNVNTPLDQRMKALVAVQDTPVRATGDLLRTLLADPADDIRLLAYGILDNKEKTITQRILDHQQALQRAGTAAERRSRHKRIAELYWELAFQNLVQGDMLLFSADQARMHATEALRDGDDAGLWFLLARLELRAHRIDAAEQALDKARECGFARERLLPYIAELRFLQKRFTEVRGLFVELADEPGVPALAQSRRFWLGASGPLS